jgi:hypothetical protein
MMFCSSCVIGVVQLVLLPLCCCLAAALLVLMSFVLILLALLLLVQVGVVPQLPRLTGVHCRSCRPPLTQRVRSSKE